MIYKNIEGSYKKVNGIYRNINGAKKEINTRYEIINGSVKKVYHPWVLVKNGKLINRFHLIFVNSYNQTIIDLKDYTNLYENDEGVWIELSKVFSYTGYLPRTTHMTRFMIGFNIPSYNQTFNVTDYKMASTYRSINYRCTQKDTLWGMFPYGAGGGSREDFHVDTTSVNGTWTGLVQDCNNENVIVNNIGYATIVGLQAINAANRTVTYNSLKLCIKDFYAYNAEM